MKTHIPFKRRLLERGWNGWKRSYGKFDFAGELKSRLTYARTPNPRGGSWYVYNNYDSYFWRNGWLRRYTQRELNQSCSPQHRSWKLRKDRY